MRKPILLVGMAIVASMLAPPAAQAIDDDVWTKRLRKEVNSAGILAQERSLQRIANENGGTRAASTDGHKASVDFAKKAFRSWGYEVKTQSFEFPFFEELAPSEVKQVSPDETTYESITMDYSGSGDVVGELVPTDDVLIPPPDEPGSTSGCEASDFPPADPVEPQVALVQRGTCSFFDKATNAEAAGYDAVLIFNEGQPGRQETLAGTLGAPVDIPAVGLSFDSGADLYAAAQAGTTMVSVSTLTMSETRTTRNVLADLPGGDTDQTVIVGGHLDSVVAGPGINDNGSGTATILEVAKQLAALDINPRRHIRFALWSAEEFNLKGSQAYVDSLSDAQLQTIYANLNFDMLGSPNFVRFVYDGDGSDTGTSGPAGSDAIEGIFTDYFDSQGLESDPTAFDGRSDYGPFIDVGIPAGGLFSGAEGIKTDEQAAIYGGTAGDPYDSCYHQACDDVNNLNSKALGQMGDAVADAVLTMARSKSGLFDDSLKTDRVPVSSYTFDYRGGLVR